MRQGICAAMFAVCLTGCPAPPAGAPHIPTQHQNPLEAVPRAYEDAIQKRTQGAEKALERATGEAPEAPRRGAWKRTGKKWGGGKQWGGGKPWGK